MNTPNIADYDYIVINSSAGKDSLAMLDYLVGLAIKQDVPMSRFLVAHADLGDMEWKGTKELAEKQASHYGVKFQAIARPQGNLLEHVRARGKWPSSKQRYCTSDHKRGQIEKVIRHLRSDRLVTKVLNCMGVRADESPARAKKRPLETNYRISTNLREVNNWLPIHNWTAAQVWDRIRPLGKLGLIHPAYSLGMPRLSCCFCIFAPRNALMIAGQHNPDLLDKYVKVEQEIGHTFKKDFRIAAIKEALDRGEKPGHACDWKM